MSLRGKENHGKKLRRRKNYGKTERDGQAWLPDDPPKVETSLHEESFKVPYDV
jgi:hypothetical protein